MNKKQALCFKALMYLSSAKNTVVFKLPLLNNWGWQRLKNSFLIGGQARQGDVEGYFKSFDLRGAKGCGCWSGVIIIIPPDRSDVPPPAAVNCIRRCSSQLSQLKWPSQTDITDSSKISRELQYEKAERI